MGSRSSLAPLVARAPGAGRGRSDVLFLAPPGGETEHFAEHLGVAYLRATLLGSGVRSEQLLPEGNVSAAGLALALGELRPAIVGLTVYEANLRTCRAAAQVVRRTLPEAVIVAGGPNATFSPAETLELLGVDACLRGAGEARLPRLAEVVLGASEARAHLSGLLAEIPGLLIATKDGVLATADGETSSFPGAPYTCLDDLPSPYGLGLVASPGVGLMTARGCNQHCTYCSFAEISGRRIRFHGVDRVLDDLRELKALSLRSGRRPGIVPFHDDAFTLEPARARRICEAIVRLGLQMRFSGQTRADRVDLELLRLMKAAGFEAVNFGLESAVPRVLRAIGKVQDPTTDSDPGLEREREFLERVRIAVAAARMAGLLATVSVIGGLPTETADDFRATLEYVASLGVEGYVHNALSLFPGTPAYRDRIRLGLSAERDRETGTWSTRRSFDVTAVSPIRGSSLRGGGRVAAREIADAICGRGRGARTDGRSAWAVLLHGCRPGRRLAAWLSEIVAYHAAIVVIAGASTLARRGARAWHRVLYSANVPYGSLHLLARHRATSGALRLRSMGGMASHRFRMEDRLDGVQPGLADDDLGGHTVAIWLVSGDRPSLPPAGDPAWRQAAPQMADSCRLWSSGRRCSQPMVLHVWRDGSVTPCWRGPVIGAVGDPYESLAARGRALPCSGSASPRARSRLCPMSRAGDVAPGVRRAVEAWELNGQLEWLLRGVES